MSNAAPAMPSKILMTADPIGGVWTYALELAKALAPQGVEIALATMGGAVSWEQRQELGTLPNVELCENRCRLEWMDEPWADVQRSGEWLLDLAARFAPDVVHLNGFCHGALPWPAPVLIVAHSCVLSWWAAVKAEAAPARFDAYRRRVGEGLAAADWVAAPTAAMLASLEQNYGSIGRARVIYNGRDPGRFTPGIKQPRIFSAGRLWDEAKNVRALDRAAPAVRWPISVAGDGEHPNGSQVKLENVRGLGQLNADEMTSHFSESAIYALPARYEPFGLSAVEAGLCGCALVLGDIPSLREVWDEAALFVAPDDEHALAAALNALIDDEGRRAELGRRARARALEFSTQKMALQYLAVYGACLARQPLEVAA
jgi:glycogen(starch) synthase